MMKRSKIARVRHGHGQRNRKRCVKQIFAGNDVDNLLGIMEEHTPMGTFTRQTRTVLKDFFGNISEWLVTEITNAPTNNCKVYWREHPMFASINDNSRLLTRDGDIKIKILDVILSDFKIRGRRLIFKDYEADIESLFLCMLDAHRKQNGV
jgi:hypothetical protein